MKGGKVQFEVEGESGAQGNTLRAHQVRAESSLGRTTTGIEGAATSDEEMLRMLAYRGRIESSLRKLHEKMTSERKQEEEVLDKNNLGIIYNLPTQYDIGVYQTVGGKKTQEDTFTIVPTIADDGCLLAIFDGHGDSSSFDESYVAGRHTVSDKGGFGLSSGQSISINCALKLKEIFESNISDDADRSGWAGRSSEAVRRVNADKANKMWDAQGGGAKATGDNLEDFYNNLFNDLQDDILGPDVGPGAERVDSEEAKKELNWREKLLLSNGTTAVIAYLENDNLTVANVGDARAVLGTVDDSGGMKAHALSYDHIVFEVEGGKKLIPEEYIEQPGTDSLFYISGLTGKSEYDRVTEAGGEIILDRNRTNYRLQSTHAQLTLEGETTRSIGDKCFAGKSNIPNVYEVPDINAVKGRVLILACDGLWDNEIGLTNEEAVNHAITRLNAGANSGTISKELADLCVMKNTHNKKKQDNTTVIVVDLLKKDGATVSSLTGASAGQIKHLSEQSEKNKSIDLIKKYNPDLTDEELDEIHEKLLILESDKENTLHRVAGTILSADEKSLEDSLTSIGATPSEFFDVVNTPTTEGGPPPDDGPPDDGPPGDGPPDDDPPDDDGVFSVQMPDEKTAPTKIILTEVSTGNKYKLKPPNKDPASGSRIDNKKLKALFLPQGHDIPSKYNNWSFYGYKKEGEVAWTLCSVNIDNLGNWVAKNWSPLRGSNVQYKLTNS